MDPVAPLRPSKKRRTQQEAAARATAPTGSSAGDGPSQIPVEPRGFDPAAMQRQFELFVDSGDLDSALVLGELLVAVALAPPNRECAVPRPSNCLDASTESYADSFIARRPQEQLDGDAVESGEDRPLVLTPQFHAKTLRLFADLMVARREFKRAIRYYRRSCKEDDANTAQEELDVKLKVARCWVQLDSAHQAIEVLTSTSPAERTLSMNLLLGKLYLDEGLRHRAEESYAAAIRQNPYALEASLALAELAAAKDASSNAFVGSDDGVNTTEDGGAPNARPFRQHKIERLYSKLWSAQVKPSMDISAVDAAWMQTLVTAHMHVQRGQHREAVESFDALEHIFPRNLHCLLHKGTAEMQQELYHQAHVNFDRARQADDLNLALMDRYADCLRKSGARTQLNSVVHELFEASNVHAEPWLAAAYYNDLKGEHELALQFCERAITIRRRHAPAHLFRGEVLLRLHQPEHALGAFSTACRLTRSLEAYAGVITSYCDLYSLGVNRFKEAVATARSVVKLFPHKAESFTLLGSVLALRPERREQAREALEKALVMEPRRLATNFALVDLLVSESNFSAAIEKLQALADRYAREEVFTKLAHVHTLNKQYAEAMTYFHRSLRMNPASAEALRGLDRLEKLMRGEDPDEISTTMEQMGSEDPEDSIEAGEFLTP